MMRLIANGRQDFYLAGRLWDDDSIAAWTNSVEESLERRRLVEEKLNAMAAKFGVGERNMYIIRCTSCSCYPDETDSYARLELTDLERDLLSGILPSAPSVDTDEGLYAESLLDKREYFQAPPATNYDFEYNCHGCYVHA